MELNSLDTSSTDVFRKKFLEDHFSECVKAESCFLLRQKVDQLLSSKKDKIQSSLDDVTRMVGQHKENLEHLGREADALLNRASDAFQALEAHQQKEPEHLVGLSALHSEFSELIAGHKYLETVMKCLELNEAITKSTRSKSVPSCLEAMERLHQVHSGVKTLGSHLATFVRNILQHHYGKLLALASCDLTQLLADIKWPFPSGIQAPSLDVQKLDIVTLFRQAAHPLGSLHMLSSDLSRLDAAEDLVSLPLQVLCAPFKKRFLYSFYGNRPTSRLDKPEFFFTQILIWIRDHLPFLQNTVVAALEEFPDIKPKEEFIHFLVDLAVQKVHSLTATLTSDETLFLHLTDQVVLFEAELQQQYPDYFPEKGCMKVLLREPVLSSWLETERKSLMVWFRSLMEQDMSYEPQLAAPPTETDTFRTTVLIHRVLVQHGVLYSRCKLVTSKVQQHLLLSYSIQFLQDVVTEINKCKPKSGYLATDKKLHSLLNSLAQLHHAVKTLADTTWFIGILEWEAIQADEALPNVLSGLLDDLATSIDGSTKESIDSMVTSAVPQLSKMLRPYRTERWASLPSLSDYIKPDVLPSASSFIMLLKQTLTCWDAQLCRKIARRACTQVSAVVDNMLFQEVVAENIFNAGGAQQLGFDVDCLSLLFSTLLTSAAQLFPRTREAVHVLRLPLDVAGSTKNQLVSMDKSGGWREPGVADIVRMRLGVVTLTAEESMLVLANRADLRKT